MLFWRGGALGETRPEAGPSSKPTHRVIMSLKAWPREQLQQDDRHQHVWVVIENVAFRHTGGDGVIRGVADVEGKAPGNARGWDTWPGPA